MGLAHRIIPTFLIRGETLVKGRQFESWRSVGHPLTAVKTHQARGVDELIILDIGATPEGRGPNLALIEKLTAECFSPVTVGGGVRNVLDVRDLLNAGADKVAICTGLAKGSLVRQCADKFGSQAIVAAIDYTIDGVVFECGKTQTSWLPHYIAEAQYDGGMGAGEILLTSVQREGMMTGYGLEVIRQTCELVRCPVVAHGGCGSPQHMLEAINAGASAVAAGALFQFTDTTPKDCAKYLHKHGIEVRLDEPVRA